MTRTGTRSPLLAVIVVGFLIAAAGATYGQKQRDEYRKVTFYGAVGDGKAWAGGFTMVVTINARSTPYQVKALAPNVTAINTYLVTKKVKRGTAVGCLITAEWPGKLVKAQLRGEGVDTRPAVTTSPLQPYASAVVK